MILGALSSLAMIMLRDSLLLYFNCVVAVCVLCLFLMMPCVGMQCVGMQCVIVVFPGSSYLLFPSLYN